MCHKKVGNEEGTRRARANLKDVHWCVTFVYCKLRLMSPTPHCWMLHVRPFTHHGTLLRVVRSCCANLETGLTFESTTPNISFVPWSPKRSLTMLDPFAQLFKHCWSHAHALHTVYKVLWVVSFSHCLELLHPFAHHCQHRRNNSQHCWPNNVWSCCVCVGSGVQTDPTTRT